MTDPSSDGRFGSFGGMFVPETLIPACEALRTLSEQLGQTSLFERNSTHCSLIMLGDPRL